MKIICVCGMGLGSSVIAKMNIESVLRKLKIDATVETCDLGSINSVTGDLYVTTREICETFPKNIMEKTVVLTNFVKKSEIESVIEPMLKKVNK